MDEAGREMSGHVVKVIWVDTTFSAYYCDVGFNSKVGQVRGQVNV